MSRLPTRVAAGLVVVALGLGTAGCGIGSSDGRPTVVAAFYPLAWAAQEVGGSDVDVIDLTTPGVEPHDLELGVRQTAQVSAAELVVYEKGFQPSVDQAVAQNSDHGFDVSGTVRLRRADGGTDPHFWQDPERMRAYVEELGSRLAAVDPAAAPRFRARADALAERLDTLARDYRAGLAHCRVTTIVVGHDAFGYLSGYGLTVQGIAGLTPDAEPSARRIREVQRLVRSDGISTVFSEVLASPKLAEALARDVGVRTAVLDPIEGVARDAPAGTGYLTLMRDNLRTLRKANSCS